MNTLNVNVKDKRMYAPLKIFSDAEKKDTDKTSRKGRYKPGIYQITQYDSYCDIYYPEYIPFVPFNFFEPLFMQNCPGARPGWMATINLFDAKPMWDVPDDLISYKSVQRLWYVFHLILRVEMELGISHSHEEMIHPREIEFVEGADDLYGMRFEWSAEELPSKAKWNKYFGLQTSHYGQSLTAWVNYIENQLDLTISEMENVDGIKVGGDPNSENNKSPCTLGNYVRGFAIFHLFKVIWANPDGPQGKGFTDKLPDGTSIVYTPFDGTNPFLVYGTTYQNYLPGTEYDFVYWETGERHWAADFWSNGIKPLLLKESDKLVECNVNALKGAETIIPLDIPPSVE